MSRKKTTLGSKEPKGDNTIIWEFRHVSMPSEIPKMIASVAIWPRWTSFFFSWRYDRFDLLDDVTFGCSCDVSVACQVHHFCFCTNQ